MSARIHARDDTEKVKRRMIRTIGRLLQEKKPEDEIWEYMEKEYGKKCKILWDRMRVLTMKKLKCLFNADDVVNHVPKMARMTLTDWLIFDLVLVHEKIDVIDMKSIRDNKPSKVLQNLFSLVVSFEIEGRCGDDLADAWISATVHYNSLGHQCSPMLLQRRWYQLKELTRSTFYKFWFIFRGNKRQLTRAKEDSPISELQRDIALRYSHIITQPLKEWEELIKLKIIIMPDEFELKMRKVNLMKPTDLSGPDLVLVEPKISTIDLCDDSDIEEVDEDTTKANSTENYTEKPTAIELSPVMIKTEPIDLDNDSPQEPDNIESQNDDNNDFDEEIQRLQLVENEIIIDTDCEAVEDRESDSHTPDGNEESARESTEDIAPIIDENETQVNMEDDIVNTTETQNIEVEDTIDTIQESIQTDNRNNELDDTEANLIIKSEIDQTNTDNYVENMNANETNQPDLVVKVEKDALINEASENVFPVIATVSSAGIPVNINTAIDESYHAPIETDDVLPQIDVQLENLREKIIDSETKIDNLRQIDDRDSSSDEDIIKIPAPVVNNELLSFNDDIPHDLEFADDGIQLVDDGIEYQSEEEENKSDDDQPRIDKKLLMVPVVYTTKLDNMLVFKQRLLFDGVNQKDILEKIIVESKPISKLALKSENKVKTKKTMDQEPTKYQENRSVMDADVFNKLIMAANDDKLTVKEEPQDLEENVPHDSSEDEVEVPRIKYTSFLLRKPRRRSYNPIQLCKNPDFNTRLKRLPVSFFTIHRNRLLLNECKPMTIDVSKAFESKLVNGTIYLTNTEQSNFIPPKPINADTVPTVSVITPSANPVQSLMDIDKLLEEELKKRMCERNKTINLPDITEVRRINQHLLTAEVTPLRITPSTSPVNEDVPIVIDDDSTLRQQDVKQTVTNKEVIPPTVPPKPIIAPQPTVIPPKPTVAPSEPKITKIVENTASNTSQNFTSLNKKRKFNRKNVHPTLNWSSGRLFRTPIDNSDLLLTTDTLYKMLFAIDPAGVKTSSYNKYVKENIKTKVVLQKQTIFTPKGLSHKKVEDESIEIVDDKPENNDEDEEKHPENDNEKKPEAKAKVKVVYDKSKIVRRRRYCCWASARMELLNGTTSRIRSHKCREICSCCCKLKLADMIFTNETVVSNAQESKNKQKIIIDSDDQLKNACESIESVVQQTRVFSQDKPLYVPAAMPITKVTSTNTHASATVATQVDLTSTGDTVTEANVLPPRSERPPSLLEKLAQAQAQAKILKRQPKLPIDFEKLSQPDKSQWTLCPCKRPVLKLSDQRTIVVDGTSNCSYHPKRKDFKQGQLYINRKGKNERPIFIGKNKLLLTNVKRLSENSTPPSVVPSIASVPAAENLQMPEGVQIILLPNGTLTYNVDPAANVTEEKLTIMPAILAAIQTQINSGNLAVIDQDALALKNPVNEASDIIGFQEGQQTSVPVESVAIPTPETTMSIPAEIMSVDDAEPNNIASNDTPNNLNHLINEPNDADNSVTSPNKETNALQATPPIQVNETYTDVNQEDDENKLVIVKNNDENINKNSNINTTKEAEAIPTESTLNSTPNEIESVAQKSRTSLLSDLMEMSGIDEEDIAPVAAPMPQNIVDTGTTGPNHVALAYDLNDTPLVAECPQATVPVYSQNISPEKSNIKDIYANLCTVNSFSELKYAYNNNGLFFKLDLDSGVIVPITLCIKKKQAATAAAPTSGTVIDLTDDLDNEEEKITFNTTSPTGSPKSILTSQVFKRVLNEVKIAEKTSVLKRVKPNILQKKHYLSLKQRSLLKTCPKQKKIVPDKIDAQIDLVDSDNPMEEEYLNSSDTDTSDDEPLAKKVKRVAIQRENTTPIDWQDQIDSIGDNSKTEESTLKNIGDRVGIESPMEDYADFAGDSPTESAENIDSAAVVPSAVTLDDPKPTHLVLTRDDHHETVPIDTFYNDNGDDDDSQGDCILGV